MRSPNIQLLKDILTAVENPNPPEARPEETEAPTPDAGPTPPAPTPDAGPTPPVPTSDAGPIPPDAGPIGIRSPPRNAAGDIIEGIPEHMYEDFPGSDVEMIDEGEPADVDLDGQALDEEADLDVVDAEAQLLVAESLASDAVMNSSSRNMEPVPPVTPDTADTQVVQDLGEAPCLPPPLGRIDSQASGLVPMSSCGSLIARVNGLSLEDTLPDEERYEGRAPEHLSFSIALFFHTEYVGLD